MSVRRRVTPNNRDELYTKYKVKPNGLIVIRSVEDLFCECGTILKPVWDTKRFRTGGKKIELVMFVAKCARCKTNYDCNNWREVLWARTEEARLMLVIDKKEDIETLPTIRRECVRCGPTVHTYYSIQTRSSDEPETTFYKCKNCGKVQRENV